MRRVHSIPMCRAQIAKKEKRIKALKFCSEKTNFKILRYNEYIKAMATGGKDVHLFIECLFRELGYISTNGMILYEKVKKIPMECISPESYSSIVDLCKTETCYKFSKCLLTNVRKTFQQYKIRNQKYRQVLKMCSKRIHYKISQHSDYTKALYAGGEKIWSLSKCIFKELDYLDNNGTILYEKVKATPTQKIFYKVYAIIVDKCKTEKSSNTNETYYKFAKCLFHGIETYQQYKWQRKKYLQALKVCSKKTNFKIKNYSEHLKALNGGGKQIQIFSKCFLRERRYLNSDGVILYEKIKKTPPLDIPFEKYIKIVDLCKIEIGGSVIETCYKFSHCLFSNVLKTYRQQKKQMPKFGKAIRVCSKKNNITISTYKAYLKTLVAGGNQIQSFSECLLQELGYLGNNGVILYEEIKKTPMRGIPYRNYSNFVDECSRAKGNCSTETAYKFLKCLLMKISETDPKNKLKPQKHTHPFKVCSRKANVTILAYNQFIAALATGGEHIQAFSECILHEIGYLSFNKTILYDEIKKTPPNGISYEKYSRIVNECKEENGNNSAERSYKFLKCLLSEVKVHSQRNDEQVFKICSEKTSLSIYKYTQLIEALNEDGTQIQLYTECWLRERGYLNENRTILYEEVKNIPLLRVYPEKYASIIDKCKNKYGKSTTETCYKFLKCLFVNLVEFNNQYKPHNEKYEYALNLCSKKVDFKIFKSTEYIKLLAEGKKNIELFSECLFKELGYLDNDGKILYEKIKQTPSQGISPEKYSAIVDLCKTRIGKSSTKTIFKFSKCLSRICEQETDYPQFLPRIQPDNKC
ncbi:hypothetical protein FQA39_LY08085 [Lamprigera yunnana]|nr:hypothetical protein FQA39_LY08085 [Lamprigera yunnana]